MNTPMPVRPATGPELQIERIDTPEGLDVVRAIWDGFVEEAGSDIYFSVDWLQAWWTHYGRGRRLECLIVRDGPNVVAVLPFCVQRVWAGPIPVRLARFVGADSTIPVALAVVGQESVPRLRPCFAEYAWPVG